MDIDITVFETIHFHNSLLMFIPKSRTNITKMDASDRIRI